MSFPPGTDGFAWPHYHPQFSVSGFYGLGQTTATLVSRSCYLWASWKIFLLMQCVHGYDGVIVYSVPPDIIH